jgi:PAS domain S-box-containing protein
MREVLLVDVQRLAQALSACFWPPAVNSDALQKASDASQCSRSRLSVTGISPDSAVEAMPVTIDRDFGTSAQLRSGLKGHEELVLDPTADLANGSKVRVDRSAARGGQGLTTVDGWTEAAFSIRACAVAQRSNVDTARLRHKRDVSRLDRGDTGLTDRDDQNPITRALLSAMMHSTEPMVLTDPNLPDHPMIAVNTAFEKMTGYPRRETFGRNCRFLQGPKTDPQTPSRIRACIAERRGCIEWIVNYRRNGEMFWNLLFMSPVFSRAGELLHYFGNQRDITAGPPASLPDYIIGKADMPPMAEIEFHAMLLGLLDTDDSGGTDEHTLSRALESLVESARRLDQMTTGLAPAPWVPR